MRVALAFLRPRRSGIATWMGQRADGTCVQCTFEGGHDMGMLHYVTLNSPPPATTAWTPLSLDGQSRSPARFTFLVPLLTPLGVHIQADESTPETEYWFPSIFLGQAVARA